MALYLNHDASSVNSIHGNHAVDGVGIGPFDNLQANRRFVVYKGTSMTTEAGYDLTPGRTWGTTTKVSLVIRGPDELDACIVDEWRSLLRSMTLTKGGWPVPDTSIQIHLTKENVLALEDEMRALGLT